MKDKIYYKNFSGDERIRPYVEYKRNTEMRCIYCGDKATTREHVPSKVFLKIPLPPDLPTVPACKSCNSSYSRDELYTDTYIELLKSYLIAEYKLCPKVLKIINNSPVGKKVQENVRCSFFLQGNISFDELIGRILCKLAKGHVVYELSIINITVSSISYTFLPYLNEEQIATWNDAINISDEPFPEIGSRVFDRIYPITYNLRDKNGDEISKQLVLLDWYDVQDDRYRYICYNIKGDIIVRIVIKEFLFAEIKFSNNYDSSHINNVL